MMRAGLAILCEGIQELFSDQHARDDVDKRSNCEGIKTLSSLFSGTKEEGLYNLPSRVEQVEKV